MEQEHGCNKSEERNYSDGFCTNSGKIVNNWKKHFFLGLQPQLYECNNLSFYLLHLHRNGPSIWQYLHFLHYYPHGLIFQID